MTISILEGEARSRAIEAQKAELSSEELLSLLLHIADIKQAENPIAIKIEEVSSIGDYLLIMHTNSSRLLKTIVDSMREQAKVHNLILLNNEGVEDENWLVLDFASVIVHVLSKPYREKYNLEELWKKGEPVDNAKIMQANPFILKLT